MRLSFLFGISLFFTFTMVQGYAQKQGYIWHFGEGAGLDFNSGEPVVIGGGQVYADPENTMEFIYSEGAACISDSTGRLLFYSNGEKVWNRDHEVMPNGDDLMGMYSSSHPAFIVPQPLSDSIYYVFTTDGLERDLEDGLRYSVVNMCLENGLGDVVEGQKNMLLLDLACEKLTAVNHANGKDIWLIAHEFNSDAFYAYQISELGIVNTVVTEIGSVHTGNLFYSAIGQMKASPDGTMIGLVFSNVNPAVAELFSFDNETGILSNPLSLETNGNEYGFEFSPDNTKVYFTNLSGLFQFDLTAGGGSEEAINLSKVQIMMPYSCGPAGLQLGPNGKIYVGRCDSFLGVINEPNVSGNACNFEDEAIQLGTTASTISFPSFIHGYEYHNNTFECGGVNIESEEVVQLQVYPNPASDQVIIDGAFPSNARFKLLNPLGQVVLQEQVFGNGKHTIMVNELPSGVFFYQLTEGDRVVASGRLVIE